MVGVSAGVSFGGSGFIGGLGFRVFRVQGLGAWAVPDARQVHSVFPARECVRAHQLMDSGDFTGKIVLTWTE